MNRERLGTLLIYTGIITILTGWFWYLAFHFSMR